MPTKRCLLVEDDPIALRVAGQILNKLEVAYETANNGAQAVARIREDASFDFVIMDLQMPIMDGMEATRRIREITREKAHLPIYLSTSTIFTPQADPVFEVGFDGFMSKPLRFDDIEQVLSATARGSEVADDPTRDEIDFEHFDALFQPGDQEARDIVQDFMKAGPQALESLRAAARGRDRAEFTRVAHRLRGSCTGMGLSGLADRLTSWEEQAREGTLNGFTQPACDKLITDMTAQLEQLSARLSPKD